MCILIGHVYLNTVILYHCILLASVWAMPVWCRHPAKFGTIWNYLGNEKIDWTFRENQHQPEMHI